MQTLVDADTLKVRLGDPAWRVFDCRFSLADPEAGRAEYLAAHIPGAVHADVDRHLSGRRVPGVTGRHPLPDKNDWIERVRAWGLSPDVQIVLYDDSGGAFAARMWWMLRWIGHEKAAVLDGGWAAWLARERPVTADVPAPAARAASGYAARPSLTRLIDAAAIDGRTQTLLDARDPPRFRGEHEPIDPIAGHIPGAVCAPSAANLDEHGVFRSSEALRRRFEALIGPVPEKDIVCYCGSGITAAHNVLALRHAGFAEPLLYAGSWSEWIADPRRPVAVGD